ncbi:hypothetical protein OIK79_002737 [Salmonella enterica]|nr:hypothetical protein [Salmonella enterica]
MGRNLSGLHLKIAEWIRESGEAVSIYEVSQQFGVTLRQAIGLLSSILTDSAIETQIVSEVVCLLTASLKDTRKAESSPPVIWKWAHCPCPPGRTL